MKKPKPESRRSPISKAERNPATVAPDDRREKILASALRRAKRGRKLLPLFHVKADGTCACGDPDCQHVGKHPWVQSGTQPSSDQTVIKGWFECRPDSNLGEMIPADELVLDVDYRHGGEASFHELEQELGRLPETIKVRTGSGDGSFHLRFRRPPGRLMGFLGPGVQVKASGYAVVPPSKTAKPYLVRRSPVPMTPAELPEAWIERLKKINRPTPDTLLKRAIEKSQTEGRNNTGEWLARQLWDNRYLKTEIRDCVREYQETVRDAVPGEEPYSVKEAKATIRSVCSTPRRDPWSSSPLQAQLISTQVEPLRLMRVGELLKKKFPDQEWIWENRLPAGGSSIISSKPKVGKTTFLTELGVRISRGENFLGWKTKQGPVIFLFFEELEAEIQSHLKLLGVTKDDPIHLLVSDQVGERGIERLEKSVADIKPVLVVIDPLFDMMRVEDANPYAAVKRALTPYHQLARRTGVHIACAHHRGKADRPGMDGILGSTALHGGVDTLIHLTRENQDRHFSTQQRYPRFVPAEERDIPETVMRYDPGAGTLSLGQPVKVLVEQRVRQDIIAFLKTQSSPVSREKIEEQVTGTSGLIRPVLRELVDYEKVIETGQGRRGDPFMYSLKPTP